MLRDHSANEYYVPYAQSELDAQYDEMLRSTMLFGREEHNARTGVSVRVSDKQHLLSVGVRGYQVPLVGCRDVSLRVAAEETLWQLRGTKEGHPHIWNDFVDPDTGVVENAYGHRMRNRFERDQLLGAMESLRLEPSSRQALVSLWDPSTDGCGAPRQQGGVPCPFAFQLMRTGTFNGREQLALCVFQRSCDLVVGLPYDIANFALLGHAMACSIGWELSRLTFLLSHVHVYKPQWSAAKRYSKGEWARDRVFWPTAPDMSVGDILEDPDRYLKRISNSQSLAGRHKVRDRHEVVV